MSPSDVRALFERPRSVRLHQAAPSASTPNPGIPATTAAHATSTASDQPSSAAVRRLTHPTPPLLALLPPWARTDDRFRAGTNPEGLPGKGYLPDTVFINYLRWKRSRDPQRFDFNHRGIAPALARDAQYFEVARNGGDGGNATGGSGTGTGTGGTGGGVTENHRGPVVVIQSPSAGTFERRNVSVSGRAIPSGSPIVRVQAQVIDRAGKPGTDRAPFNVAFDRSTGNFSFPTSLALDGSADGPVLVRVRAVDRAGRISPFVTDTFTLDTQPPNAVIDHPSAPGATVHDNLTITGHVSDKLSGVASLRERTDSGPWINVAFNGSGAFSLTTTLATDGSADGPHTVELVAADRAGNTSAPVMTTFTLSTHAATNTPPTFTSTPVVTAQASTPYSYQATATDPDAGDQLTFSAIAAPEGLHVDPASGLVTWTPAPEQVGSQHVSLKVDDGHGGTATQDYTITVHSAPAANSPPAIISTPVTSLNANEVTGHGALVDLTPWSVQNYPVGREGPSNWVLDSTHTLATETNDADPTILLSNFNLTDDAMSGHVVVNANDDADSIGIVFDYVDAQHFYLFDWKQGGNNYPSADALGGMTIKRVDAGTPAGPNLPLDYNDLGPTKGNPGRVTTLYYNPIAWTHFTDYTFTLVVHPGTFTITVAQGPNTLANITIHDNTYTTGKFGFYNASQEGVQYSAFRRLSLPASGYQYQASAIDPDRTDTLSWSLPVAPSGLAIDPNTGLISGSPLHPGNALRFNGADSVVSIPDSTSLHPTNLTVSAWVNFETLDTANATQSGLQYILFKKNTRTTNDTGFSLSKVRVNGLDELCFTIQSANGATAQAFSSTLVDPGSWYQVAGTYDGNNIRLYVNGLLQATVHAGFPLDLDTSPVMLGTSGQASPDGRFQGWMDDVRVWDTALSDAQVAATSGSEIDPTTAGLIADYNFDESQGTILHDLTTNHNDGTLASRGTPDGLPAWTASTAPLFVNTADVTVRVDDGHGGFDTQSFTINGVAEPPGAISGVVYDDRNNNGQRDPVTTTQGGNESQHSILLLTWNGAGNSVGPDLTAAGWNVVIGSLNPGQVASALSAHPDIDQIWIWNDGASGANGPADPARSFNAADLDALAAFNATHPYWIMDETAWRTEVTAGERSLTKNEAAALSAAGGGIVLGALNTGAGSRAQHANQVADFFHFYEFAGMYTTDRNTFQEGGSLTTTPNTVALADLKGSNQVNFAGDAPHGNQPNGQYLSTVLFGTGGQTSFPTDPPLQADTFNSVTYTSVNHIITTTIPGAGIDPIMEPGLDGRTVYLDLNHNGILDTGEPSAVTGADGSYIVSNVPPGNYTLSVLGQPGWSPSSPPTGSTNVTVSTGQTLAGVSFAETQANVGPGFRAPGFASTPPATATVGQAYRYNTAVSNPDGASLTFELLTDPIGMAVDPTSGVVIWIPTLDEVGAQNVVLRVRDTNGETALQTFTVNVTAS